jgi:hypothetical protein
LTQYDPWRPDAPIPPDIFDYIAEYAAQIITYIIVSILMWYFGAWLRPIIEPRMADFIHWLGWLSPR